VSEEWEYKPLFPKERREERGGLIVIHESMTPEMSKQRREDNKKMKRIRERRTGRSMVG
jgi:hypothetical protein